MHEQVDLTSSRMMPPLRQEGGIRNTSMYGVQAAPLLTVITVVFNGASTLEHTIRSVMAQSYRNIEHIVIDGGSTDRTLDILHAYDEHIDYWVSEKDSGIYDAMNKGIKLARGKYIGMLNADDYFADSVVLEKIAQHLELTDIDAVFSCLDVVAPNDPQRILRKYRISNFSSFMLRIGVMPPHPTFYCKKSCYEKAGAYRIDYRIAADFEMMVRLLLKQRISWNFIDQVSVKMRSGGVSSRGIKSNWIVNREIVRACNENGLYTNMLMLILKLPIRLLERVL